MSRIVKIESNPTMMSVDIENELLTVTRGESISEGERITKVWNQVISGKIKETEAAALIKKIKDNKWNYSGAFYSVYFRVDTPIILHELGFFGPFKEAKASYFVHVEMYKPNEKNQVMPLSWESPRIAKTKVNVLAEKDDIFFVDLGEPVDIDPGTWYLVQFMLEGPDTIRCDTSKSTVIVEHEFGNIKFEFNKGSNQLPSLKFTLANTRRNNLFLETEKFRG